MRPVQRLLVVLLGLALAGLAGCVNIPTSGPVDRVEGQQPACQSCVNVEVAPPTAGDSASQVVEGFLRANANYQPGYSVARQFMTQAAAASWSTDQGVTIFSGSTTQEGDDAVRLKGKVLGALDQEHTFRTQAVDLDLVFQLERENGEWRIANQLSGLFVRDSAFETLYRSYDLYFIGATGALAPQPIYLPDLRAPGNVASALVKALLDGPSDWLSAAVSTAAPTRTTLSVDSVTILNGVAQVPLSEDVLQATDNQRGLLAAQLGYTLQQVTGVKKVQLLVNNQAFRVPQSESGDLAVPLDALSPDLNPVPLVSAEQLYVTRRDGQALLRINTNTDALAEEPFPGALGQGRYAISSLAVSVPGTDLAVVTDEGTVLRRTPTTSTTLTTVLDGVTGLLRPQFSRADELFSVGNQGGQQRMWVTTETKTVKVAAPEVFEAGRVLAFRISPDGSRMALIVKSGGSTQLGVARIVRSAQISVEGYRVLDTDSPLTNSTLQVARDLAWSSATELLVLAADTARGPYAPTAVSIDASSVESQTLTDDWDAVQLTALLRPQTSIPVVLARDGRAFRDDGTRWQQLTSDVGALAYPG
ncbi:Sporulation and spore germination [Friedmanniella luteola]|uniref:Sporulation and spore germination n=1 Tax=Friedmanniella luteola TaxID=546871 RepID=A0A1H1VUL6_9ACTN|nr:LpqB family beta-propeller domain-containing protein [Friedmanniella luteola]SDS88443.1 Sporulation and spore germination [Friedmanniella luteola]